MTDSRRVHGAKPKERACLLCGTVFKVPTGFGASIKYCLEHRSMDSHTRKRLFDIKNGIKPKRQRFAQKVVVDRTIPINIHSLFHWRIPLEKAVSTYNDKRVRLVG